MVEKQIEAARKNGQKDIQENHITKFIELLEGKDPEQIEQLFKLVELLN